MAATSISWATDSWNPFVGCSLASPACTNCYAMHQAARILTMQRGKTGGSPYEGVVTLVKGEPVWTGQINQASEKARWAPLSWLKPRTIFVGSMSDFFHPAARDDWRIEALAIAALTQRHTYLILTKRAADMRLFMSDPATARAVWTRASEIAIQRNIRPERLADMRPGHWPLDNVALGVSTEDQKRADERLPLLRQTLAKWRFVSGEPLLGPLDIATHLHALDLVITGGENDRGDRLTHPDWLRALRDACQRKGVKFHFKQWGAWAPIPDLPEGEGAKFWQMEAIVAPGPNDPNSRTRLIDRAGHVYRYDQHGLSNVGDGAIMMLRIGTAHSGRTLDGQTHDDVLGALPSPLAGEGGARSATDEGAAI